MHETAIPMVKMLHTCLAIHGRCKFIIFLRGQTPSLSAPTLILSLMEHFEGKAKNTVKYDVKSTFCRSIQINCNWLPGNPLPSPYNYIYIMATIENLKNLRRGGTKASACFLTRVNCYIFVHQFPTLFLFFHVVFADFPARHWSFHRFRSLTLSWFSLYF